jgi:hypothetical protein
LCVQGSSLVSTAVHLFGQCALILLCFPPATHPTSNVSTKQGNHLGADNEVSIPEQVRVSDLSVPYIPGVHSDSLKNNMTCVALAQVAVAITFRSVRSQRLRPILNFTVYRASSDLQCPVISLVLSCEHTSDNSHNTHASFFSPSLYGTTALWSLDAFSGS